MKIKICLLLIFGFLFFVFSRAEATIAWNTDTFDYNATDAGGYYFDPYTYMLVTLNASSDMSSANGNSENCDVATVVEPQQGYSAPGLSMASAAWGDSFADSSSDSGGATVSAYADNTYALDNGVGVFQNGQSVTSYIDRYFSVDSNETYSLSVSALAPLAWSGTASGSATAPQPALTGWVYLIQTDTGGNTTTLQSFSLSTLLSSSQQVSVSLVAGDLYQLVVALCSATNLGGESPPFGIVTSFDNLDDNLNSLGNIDGTFNAGTQQSPVTITASLSPPPQWLWQGATSTGSDWYNVAWFGNFYTSSDTATTWLYHQTLSWLYPVGTSTDNIWFYDPQWDGTGAWWWSNSTVFPWIYSASATDGGWYYYAAAGSTPGARWFWSSSTGQWATH